VACAGKTDLDAAVAAAERGFAVWRRTSACERSKIPRDAASRLRADVAAIAARHAEPQGRHMHVQLVVNGGALMMSDGMSTEARPGPQGLHLQLLVEYRAAWWTRALDAGCVAVAPYERQFAGDFWGLLGDPFRVRWAVLQSGSPGSAV
jgi:uncharacterized glyoxalase superfamily protein PhnB